MTAEDQAAWNTAAQMAGQAATAIAQGKTNRKTRKWNEDQIKQQRKWALEDWDRQNTYNSPAQQMARLRAAGLNPHLIYGAGSATNTASNVPSTPTMDWNPRAPDIGSILTSPVNAYMETRSFQAQQKLLDAQTLKVLSDVDTSRFDLGQKERLADTQASIMQSIATGKQLEMELNKDKNQREAIRLSKDLEEATARIAQNYSNMDLQAMQKEKGNEEIKNIKQMRSKVSEEINQMRKDGTIKDFEIQLNKAGLTKSDPLYARLAKLVADSAGLSPETIKQQIEQTTKEAVQTGKIAQNIPEILYNTLIKRKPKK